jgi:hypothetical protein
MPRSYTRKYAERPSPPYPANEYCGRVKRGNDGAMWLSSKVGSQSACTWKPVVRSPRRSRDAHNMSYIRSRSPSPVRSGARRSPVRSARRSPVKKSPRATVIRQLRRSKSPVRTFHHGYEYADQITKPSGSGWKKTGWSLDTRTDKLFYEWRRRN